MTMELFIAGLEAEGWRIVAVLESEYGWSVRADRPCGARYRLFPDLSEPDRSPR